MRALIPGVCWLLMLATAGFFVFQWWQTIPTK